MWIHFSGEPGHLITQIASLLMYKKQMKGKLLHNSCVSACRSWLIHHWKARFCADVRCWWWGSGSHSLSPSIGLLPTAPYLLSWLWLTQHCRYPMPYQ